MESTLPRVIDPCNLTPKELTGYRKLVGYEVCKDALEKVTNLEFRAVRGMRFATALLRYNTINCRLGWEVWLADTPLRIVVYFGEKMPWEPGTVMLADGDGDSVVTTHELKREYRRLCLASSYYSTWGESMLDGKRSNED